MQDAAARGGGHWLSDLEMRLGRSQWITRDFACHTGSWFLRYADYRHHCRLYRRESHSSDHGLLTNLLVGIAGSFVGGTLANVLNIQFHGWLGNLIVASIGAVLVLWIWRSIRGPATT